MSSLNLKTCQVWRWIMIAQTNIHFIRFFFGAFQYKLFWHCSTSCFGKLNIMSCIHCPFVDPWLELAAPLVSLYDTAISADVVGDQGGCQYVPTCAERERERDVPTSAQSKSINSAVWQTSFAPSCSYPCQAWNMATGSHEVRDVLPKTCFAEKETLRKSIGRYWVCRVCWVCHGVFASSIATMLPPRWGDSWPNGCAAWGSSRWTELGPERSTLGRGFDTATPVL